MHQPQSPISLSLTNGDPCPDFRPGKGGREIENQGGSRTLLPVYTPAKTTITVLQPHSFKCEHVALLRHTTTSASSHLSKHDTANTCLPATRNLTRQTRATASTHTYTGTRQLPQTKTLSDPCFRPSGSLRIDPLDRQTKLQRLGHPQPSMHSDGQTLTLHYIETVCRIQ